MLCDLLVHVDGGQAGRRRVQFATDLALRIGARLSGIHVTPPVEVPPLFKPSRVEKVAADLSLKWVRPQFKAVATEGTPKRFIFCQNCVHL
jgi:nucleotide-binding universal stress UspA family protein